MATRFWNLPQVLIWISFGDLSVPGDHLERLVEGFETPPGIGELAVSATLLSLVETFKDVDRKRVLAADSGPCKGFQGEVIQVGDHLNDLWSASFDSVTRAVQNGELTVRGLERSPRAKMEVIDPTALMRAEFCDTQVGGEARLEVVAYYRSDPQVYWTKIRFDAEEIQKRWPAAGTPGARPSRRRNVPEAEARAALARLAVGQKKKKDLKLQLKEQFPGRDIPDRAFDALFKQLPQDQKRSRGDTDRTLKRRAG
jgi:hypothetical protein